MKDPIITESETILQIPMPEPNIGGRLEVKAGETVLRLADTIESVWQGNTRFMGWRVTRRWQRGTFDPEIYGEAPKAK